MPFILSKPDDDATLRSLLKQASWVAELAEAGNDPFGRRLGGALSLKEALALLANAEHDLTESDGCGIYLLDAIKGSLILVAHTLDERCGAFPRLDPNRGFWKQGLAATGSQVLACTDACPMEVRSDLTDRCGMQKVMVAPLRSAGQAYGLVISFGKAAQAWKEQSGALFSALAQEAGPSIAAALAKEVDLNNLKEEDTQQLVDKVVERIQAQQHLEVRDALRVIQRQSMNSRQSRRRVASSLLVALELKAENLAHT
jgi:hypothetical protein